MAPKLQETTFAAGFETAISAIEADGAVIVHDFLPADVLSRFRADVVREAERREYGTRETSEISQAFWGEKTMRFTRLAYRSPAFLEIATHADYLRIADHFLLPNCDNYWVNTGQMMVLAPGQAEQWLHRDADNWNRMNSPESIEVTISCMFAIEDFTLENGATRVVPGSHRWSDFTRQPQTDEITQAVMPAGSGMIYTGRVLHGGGANQTADRQRWGLHLSYVLGWLTPEEALPLSVPWEVVRDQPESVQRLFGWRETLMGESSSRLWTVDYEDVPVGLGLE